MLGAKLQGWTCMSQTKLVGGYLVFSCLLSPQQTTWVSKLIVDTRTSPMARLVATCFLLAKSLPKIEIKNKNFKKWSDFKDVQSPQVRGEKKKVDIAIFLYLVFPFVTKKL
jgi:hypothetical protein